MSENRKIEQKSYLTCWFFVPANGEWRSPMLKMYGLSWIPINGFAITIYSASSNISYIGWCSYGMIYLINIMNLKLSDILHEGFRYYNVKLKLNHTFNISTIYGSVPLIPEYNRGTLSLESEYITCQWESNVSQNI